MIQEFSVENFRSIKEKQTISFLPDISGATDDNYLHEVKPGVRLLKLGIIYGSNASGKSNILKAVEFFRNLMTRLPENRLSGIDGYVPFLLDDTSRKKHCYLRLVFWIDGERYVHEAELDTERFYSEILTYYSSQRPTVLYERSYDAENDISRVQFSAKAGIAKKGQAIIEGNTINNCSVMAAFGKSNVEESRLNRVYAFYTGGMADLLQPGQPLSDYVKGQLLQDEDNSLKEFLLKMLRASDFNIADFEPGDGGDRNEMSFRHTAEGHVYNLPESMESRGTLRYMGMSTVLHRLLSGENFITIDEVETCIHYELLSYFLKVFLVNGTNGSQMLVTTHDVNLLDEDFIRRDAVWFVDKNDNGETSVKRLTEYGLHKTLSPYNAYKQGKLGKLPFTGNIYL
jgi:hypothetical protein